jgi:transposase
MPFRGGGVHPIGLSDLFRRLLAQSYQQLQALDSHIDHYTQEMKRQSQQDETCRRLQTIPGYGQWRLLKRLVRP